MLFSPDGKVLYSGGGSGGPCAWDVATGKEKYRMPMEREKTYVVGIGLSPDGKTLLTLPNTKGAPVQFWDAATGKSLPPPHEGKPKP